MWIENNFIVPQHVVAVIPKSKNVDEGCIVWLTSGGILEASLSAKSTVILLGLQDAR